MVRLGGGTELGDRAESRESKESRESRGSSLTCSASGLSFLGQRMCVENSSQVGRVHFVLGLPGGHGLDEFKLTRTIGLVHNSQCAVDTYHCTVHNSQYAVHNYQCITISCER